MIEIEHITKVYDGIAAVNDVSMTVETGSITAIVGTSGSGKTTLLRMINRLEEATSGTVRINGDLTSSMPKHILRRRIGYAIQGMAFSLIILSHVISVRFLLCWAGQQVKSARVLMNC